MSRFRSNALFAVIGNFAMTASLAAIIVSVAKLGSKELVGRFSYALAICTPLFLLAALRLRDVSATEKEDSDATLRDFFRLLILSNSIALVCLPLIVGCLGLSLDFLLLTALIACWRIVIGFSDIVYGFHQKSMNMKVVARLQVVRCVLTVVSFVGMFYVTKDLCYSVVAMFLANLFALILLDLRTVRGEFRYRDLWQAFDANEVQKLVRLGSPLVPLGLAGAIFALNMVVPRTLIEKHFTFAELGVFSGLAFLARFGTPVMQALGQTASSQFAKSIEAGDADSLVRLMFQTCKVAAMTGLVLTGGGWMLGPMVMTMIYDAGYVVSRTSCALIMGYATLVYISTVLTYSLIAARRLKTQLVILVVTVGTVAVLGIVLIPDFGIYGACWSLFVSAVVRLIGTGMVARQIVTRTRYVDHLAGAGF